VLRAQAGAALWNRLSAGAGAVLHIVRRPLGDLFGDTFDGTHGVHVQEAGSSTVLLFDPLGRRPIWVPKHRLAAAATQFGALVGAPGKCLVALTRPSRIHPAVQVVAGTWWDYSVVKGTIVAPGRKRRKTGGFSAPTFRPQHLAWPALHTSRTLVRMTTGAYAGHWVEPRSPRVRFNGEED
jgi:hypothetical protein